MCIWITFSVSVPLYTHLLSQGTYACGTFRRGRCGVPDEVSKAKLKNQGQFIQMQKGNLVASAWHDKRTVLILSTDPTALCSVDRHLKSGAAIQVPCPESLKNYTLYMNGVDHHDQLRSAYGIKKKTLKWWKYAFFFLVDVAICNSYLLMCESDNHVIMTRGNRSRKRTQLEYRIQLAHLLMKDYSMKRRLMQPNVQDTPCNNGLSVLRRADANFAVSRRSAMKAEWHVNNVKFLCVWIVSSHIT